MSQNAQSVFARQQPKPRMRQQRNNSVAPSPDVPADDTTDDSQLSIVPNDEDPTLDEAPHPAEPDTNDDTSPKGDPALDKDESTPVSDQAHPSEAESAQGAPTADESAPAAAAADTDDPAPQDTQSTPAADEPAQDEPERPAKPAPKKATKSAATKAGSKTRASAPAEQGSNGTALAVISPDGSVTVDPGTHLVDLRDVAVQDDPHALVDMLGDLRTVADSDLRQHVTTAISEAITTAALRG